MTKPVKTEIRYKIPMDDEAKKFIEEVLARYDTSKLQFVEFKRTRNCSTGYCAYPYRKLKRKYFHIVVRIPDWGESRRRKAQSILSWKETKRDSQGSWQGNTEPPNQFQDRTMGLTRRWKLWNKRQLEDGRWCATYDVYFVEPNEVLEMKFGDWNEELMFIFGHEMNHFLRKTKQVEGQNTQNQCDGFGIRLALEWRARQ